MAVSIRYCNIVHTIPLFKLLPGLPSRTFSSLTAFFGGIFLDFAYVRTNVSVTFRDWATSMKQRAVANDAEPAAREEKMERGAIGRIVIKVSRKPVKALYRVNRGICEENGYMGRV